MTLAVIPARGGSKRIPRKNIKPFCGRPMIAWSIDAARASGCFDHIAVSTDDEEIAEVARRAGADVPFMRPAQLADDQTATMPVIAHAIDWYAADNRSPALACCIYATAPFLRPGDIQRGLETLRHSGSRFALSVTTFAAPIQRAFRVTPAGRLQMFQPEAFATRSQDLEPAYHDAAQFYWGEADAWRSGKPIFSSDSAPVLLPRHRVQDIDTPEDWRTAEWMFQALRARPDSDE
jgi:pseudaminic acid cytidylyltransferase